MNRHPALPSVEENDIIHPSLNIGCLRQRGGYWWPTYQVQLEKEVEAGTRTLVHGTFYVFLEDKIETSRQSYVIRYGNVFMTDHWIKRTVALPTGHPDGEVEPYRAELLVEKWREQMYNDLQNLTK